MRLLVTGGCGFVGSNFVRYVLQHYGPEMITNVDALTTGRLENLAGVAEEYAERYEFLPASIADTEKVEAVLGKHQYFGVVHFAAEACAEAATEDLLRRAHRHGVRRVAVIAHERQNAAERAALAARREHRQEVVVLHAPNRYGPFQAPTELIPRIILQALRDERISLATGGRHVRNWLHVEDFATAIFVALLNGEPGTVYRVPTEDERADIDVAHAILDHLGKDRALLDAASGEELPPANAAEGGDVSAEVLEWKPRHHLSSALRGTIDWYVRNREWWAARGAG